MTPGSGWAKTMVAAVACGCLWMLGTATASADPYGRPKPVTGTPIIVGGPEHSPWELLRNQPRFPPNPLFQAGSMFLMSDGSVLVHQDSTTNWRRLVPDRHGSYINGRWHRVPSLPGGYAPLYFTSALLPDGRLVIMGGEYDGGPAQVESNRGAIYSPATNSWAPMPHPPGWASIGDAQSTVLSDGRLIMANPLTNEAAVLNSRTLTWSSGGVGKLDRNSEEGFSLLPDGRILTVDTLDQGSELFDPVSGRWTSAGRVPVQLIGPNDEQGPLVSGPDRTVLAVGATNHTAIYHIVPRSPGYWTAGPNLPRVSGKLMVAADAAGARLPNGNVLLDVSPPGQVAPVHFVMFDGHHVSLVPDNDGALSESSFSTRMLVLPTGQLLYDDTSQVYVFHTRGRPRAAWRPSITSVPTRLTRGRTYTLAGRQLAGLDQGAAYGDDFQDSTNYPLVRIVNIASKTVTYAATRNWTSVSTAAGKPSSTKVTLPPGTPLGRSRLQAVANGIASAAVTVTVTR